ncbi:hypothetical protein MESS4_90014 [Mesorhizobium sp. STM 4661]|nr:hypothetical protein MESS4_90014 [Mesorhizobium sp. STM 4661]
MRWVIDATRREFKMGRHEFKMGLGNSYRSHVLTKRSARRRSIMAHAAPRQRVICRRGGKIGEKC